LDAGVLIFSKRADLEKLTRVRKLTPLKVIGFAFRKDKGTFISGSKENNSCAGACEGDGRELSSLIEWGHRTSTSQEKNPSYGD